MRKNTSVNRTRLNCQHNFNTFFGIFANNKRLSTKMETILNDTVDPNDLRKFRKQYEEQSSRGTPSEEAQFEYAVCLTRSKPTIDIQHGIALLEDLFKRTHDTGTRRDCLYYLAMGSTRLKNYEASMKYTEAFLRIEPQNHQVKDLRKYVKNKMRTGAVLLVGGAVALVSWLYARRQTKKRINQSETDVQSRDKSESMINA